MRFILYFIIAISVLGCIKEPNTGPGLRGGSYELQVSDWRTGRVKMNLSHTTDKGGAYIDGKYIYVNLYDRDSAGTHSMINAKIDTNWSTRDKFTNFTLVYERGDIMQEISGWQQSYQPNSQVSIHRNVAGDAPHVIINFDAFYDQYYGFVSDPPIEGFVKLSGMVKAYLTDKAKE